MPTEREMEFYAWGPVIRSSQDPDNTRRPKEENPLVTNLYKHPYSVREIRILRTLEHKMSRFDAELVLGAIAQKMLYGKNTSI